MNRIEIADDIIKKLFYHFDFVFIDRFSASSKRLFIITKLNVSRIVLFILSSIEILRGCTICIITKVETRSSIEYLLVMASHYSKINQKREQIKFSYLVFLDSFKILVNRVETMQCWLDLRLFLTVSKATNRLFTCWNDECDGNFDLFEEEITIIASHHSLSHELCMP